MEKEGYGGESIKLWGCFSANGAGALHIIEGNMNGGMYQDILQQNLISEKLNLGRRRTFKQDKDHKRTAIITYEGLAWPSHSPDFNPSENFERILSPHILGILKMIC